MELQDIKRIIEALLFVSPKPLTFRVIASFLDRNLRAKAEQPQAEPEAGAAPEPADAAAARSRAAWSSRPTIPSTPRC